MEQTRYNGKNNIENEMGYMKSSAPDGHGNENEVANPVLGDSDEVGPNYHNIGFFGTIVLMMKTQIGLGVLSIPEAFNVLGLIPGVIILIAIALVVFWSDYMIGAFKRNHPEVYSIDDAAALMFGRIGREVMATCFCIYWIFVSGSGMLGTSIGLNAVSTHGTCTAVYVAVAAALGCCMGTIQTLGRISWLAWIGLISLMVAVFTVTVAVGVEDRPDTAPPGPWKSDWKFVNNPGFTEGLAAVSTLIFAYGGAAAFFFIFSEMRDNRRYTSALAWAQSGMTVVYLVVGVVVYYYCGSYVASPALGSAGALMKKICYGIAIPGLIVTTGLFIHFSAKNIFVRILRDTKHLTSNTFVHWAVWIGCTVGCTLASYIVASAIPVFNSLISLLGALLATLMVFQPYGCMWLYDNWSAGKEKKTLKWILMVCWSVFIIVVGTFLMIGGTYSAVIGIKNAYTQDGGTAAWSCADNSNSV